MSESMTGQNGVILLVMNDAPSRARIEQALAHEDLKLQLVRANSAAEALSCLGAVRADLVIASEHLADLSGLEVIARIRALDLELPIWIVRSHAEDGPEAATAAAAAMGAGAADYLILDPATLAKLPLLVHRYVALTRGRSASNGRINDGPSRDLALIAHELRSPLAGLAALVELLEGEADGPLSPQLKRRAARIRSAVERLTHVVEGISDLAQMEGGRLPLSPGPVILSEVTVEVRDALEPLLLSRAVSLQIALPADLPALQGDSFRIRQMLTSLITGMLKQTEGTTLQLAGIGHGSMVEVTICEESRGIPVEALPPAFAKMQDAGQGNSASQEEPDTLQSLGVSLARGLALLQGGSLRIGRDADGGLIASFVLPAAPAETLINADRPQDLSEDRFAQGAQD